MSLLNLTTPYEKKRIIKYAKDGIKAVYHYKDIQLITGNAYKDKEQSDQWGQVYCNIYCFFDNISIGIDMGSISRLDEREFDEVQRVVFDNGVDTTEHFINMLEDNVTNCRHIGNAQIELAKHIKPERVEAYKQARLDYREMKDKQDAERRKKREEEQNEYCEQKNKAAQQKVSDTIKSIITGGTVENIDIDVYKSRYNSTTYSVFNYLAYQYNIDIPIKVRGWINNKLLNITIRDGEITSYQYQKGKNTHGSNTAFKYIQLVLDAVNKSNNVV